MPGSPEGKFNKDDFFSVVITSAGIFAVSVLTYLADHSDGLVSGWAAPAVATVIGAAVVALNKWLKDTSK